jgi:hypothetical protein
LLKSLVATLEFSEETTLLAEEFDAAAAFPLACALAVFGMIEASLDLIPELVMEEPLVGLAP